MNRSVAVILGAFMLGLAACSDSPTQPSNQQPPNVQGLWRGSYAVQSCSETGSAVGAFCSGFSGGSLAVTLTQSGSALTGTLGIGFANLPATGSVGTDSVVVLLAASGSFAQGGTVNLNTWRTPVSGNTMSGTFNFTIVAGPPLAASEGSVTMTAALQGVNKDVAP